MDNMAQRFRHEELPETWYTQFFERYKATKPYSLSFGDRETDKRTPELMSTYLKTLKKHKRRRVAFKEDETNGFGNPIALPHINRVEENHKVDFNGVLDMLPQIMTRSPIMIERLGIRPEYQSMEQGGNQCRGKNGSHGNKKLLSQEQASEMSRKVIACVLTNVGFEASSEVPMEVLSRFFELSYWVLEFVAFNLEDSSKMMKMIALVVEFLYFVELCLVFFTVGYPGHSALEKRLLYDSIIMDEHFKGQRCACETKVKIKRRQHLVKKEIEPIFSKDDMKNGPTTEATCPNCGFGKAVFQQMQIRSADEPMSTFYWCLNEKCRHQWRED
ncbi:DNA-directed RNA polymerase III subunit RPC10 [Camellia lanceoleosa]|uniref:DNA-directed RNA polymerase III subunit RPC10 n=1 Tax=Camellia lanceoleosa TaxID=1840588 RepID=A0ACC0IP98_9ERIC|nr:DNA-directed RNA polymerase III subunit RPC10 [Camellia lanceoleosa]